MMGDGQDMFTYILVGTVVLAAVLLLAVDIPAAEHRRTTNLTDVWGAVYFPADAYNSWQVWAEYDPGVVERDLRYAADTNMNAVRVLLSYEYWRDNPDRFEQRFAHFLDTADKHDIRVLPVLFESIGADPEPEHAQDGNIRTSFAVRTPSWTNMMRHSGMGLLTQHAAPRSPAGFTRWFTERFGDDSRVLAVEIMNEPGEKPLHSTFADDMLLVARDADPSTALTMGSRDIRFNARYTTPLDVYQFHHNLPPTEENMRNELQRAETFAEQHGGKPIWLTEWQRTREVLPQEDFPENQSDYPQTMLPNYESLAPLLRNNSQIDGAFMWGLMVKPAYICNPRVMGRINGLFYPDGAVWDTDDARALAGDNALQFEERQELPDGMDWFQDKDSGRYCAKHAY